MFLAMHESTIHQEAFKYLARSSNINSEYKANLNFDPAQLTAARGYEELQSHTPVMPALSLSLPPCLSLSLHAPPNPPSTKRH